MLEFLTNLHRVQTVLHGHPALLLLVSSMMPVGLRMSQDDTGTGAIASGFVGLLLGSHDGLLVVFAGDGLSTDGGLADGLFWFVWLGRNGFRVGRSRFRGRFRLDLLGVLLIFLGVFVGFFCKKLIHLS